MNEDLKEKTYWEKKIKEHWKPFVVVIIALIFAFIGAIIVLIWFIETSPIGAQGDALIGDWSLDWIVGFMILLILWELLFVGLPVVVFFIVGFYIWWNRLSDEDKAEFKARDKKKHRTRNTGGEGGGGLLMFIAYCIYIGLQGNYYAPFSSQPYSYWVYAMFYTLMWLVIIFGIPIGIILIIVYFAVWRKKSE